MLGWLSLLGPIGKIVDSVFGYLNKKQDVDLEKYKVDGRVDIEAVRAASELSIALKDDWGVRWMRNLALFPMGMWCALGVWDKIVEHKFPSLVWSVGAFPEVGGLQYVPIVFYSVIGGLAWKAMR